MCDIQCLVFVISDPKIACFYVAWCLVFSVWVCVIYFNFFFFFF